MFIAYFLFIKLIVNLITLLSIMFVQKKMDIQWVQSICMSFKGTTEDLKWEHNLCFCVKEKIFCILNIDHTPPTLGIKVTAEEFELLISEKGINPSPYLSRGNWITINNETTLTRIELEEFIKQSYVIIKNKLPKRIQSELSE